MRWAGRAGAVLAAALVALLALAAPAAAHDGVLLTVNADGRGSVSVDLRWADGHPVSGPVAASMTAVSAAGRRVGPVPLTRLPGSPTVVYEGGLAAGRWQVTVDVALPGIGYCQAEVPVAAPDAPATPTSTRCGDPAPRPLVAPDPAPPGRPVWPIAALLIVGAGVVAGLLWFLRRPTR